MKKFFEEMKDLPSWADSVKETVSHGLPLIVFGASVGARRITDDLTSHGIAVSGYAVDEKYYETNQTYLGRPVFNFDELVKQPEKYVFILGLGSEPGEANDSPRNKRIAEFINDTRIAKSNVMLKVESISREYISDNRDAFEETYNLLEDDFSKQTMLAYLKTHITGRTDDIKDFLVPNEYFNLNAREFPRLFRRRDESRFFVDTICTT